jgi:hypothetical protein
MNASGDDLIFINHYKCKKMKKLIVVLIAAISLNGMTLAAGSPTIVKTSDKSFALYYDDWNETDLTVKIKDLSGFTLMTDKIKDEKITGKRYNLMNLPQGQYVVEISNDQKMMLQMLTLTEDAVEIIEDMAEVYYSPNINVKNGKLDLNLFSLNKDVSVNIFNVDGEVIFTTDFGSQLSITERFDLSSFDKGKYGITVKQNDRQHNLMFVL